MKKIYETPESIFVLLVKDEIMLMSNEKYLGEVLDCSKWW